MVIKSYSENTFAVELSTQNKLIATLFYGIIIVLLSLASFWFTSFVANNYFPIYPFSIIGLCLIILTTGIIYFSSVIYFKLKQSVSVFRGFEQLSLNIVVLILFISGYFVFIFSIWLPKSRDVVNAQDFNFELNVTYGVPLFIIAPLMVLATIMGFYISTLTAKTVISIDNNVLSIKSIFPNGYHLEEDIIINQIEAMQVQKFFITRGQVIDVSIDQAKVWGLIITYQNTRIIPFHDLDLEKVGQLVEELLKLYNKFHIDYSPNGVILPSNSTKLCFV